MAGNTRTSTAARRGWGWRTGWGLAVVLLLAGTPSAGRAAGALVRWSPITDRAADGYHVYARQAGTPYGSPLDAGLPVAEPDGTLTYQVSNLDPNRTYYFAVSAYAPGRRESALSDELPLGPTDSCVIDRCRTPTHCEFSLVADDTPCLGPQVCGVCQAGACRASAEHHIGPQRLAMRSNRRGVRLKATVRFANPVVPRSDLLLKLSNDAGSTLYRAAVPPEALLVSRSGRRLRLADPVYVASSAPGLEALSLRLRRRSALVTMRIASAQLEGVLDTARLTVALQLGGGECLVEHDVLCVPTSAGARCR